MNTLFILNTAPYGDELAAKGRVLLCGTCMEARGLKEDEIVEGAQRSTMDELAKTTLAADKVIVS
jgi:uncharacterized protein involved in oxidation of intracellular sulfur